MEEEPPGSPVQACSAAGGVSQQHLRRRLAADGTRSSNGAATAGPLTRKASLEHSNDGSRLASSTGDGHSSAAGKLGKAAAEAAAAVRHPSGAVGLPLASGGGVGPADEQDAGGSPKIGAYRGPVTSITKHYFTANYNMDADAVSASSKSASEASTTPLIPPRAWISTHAYIQGLTLLLLVGMLGLFTYNVLRGVLMMRAYATAGFMAMVPLGVVFFSFAASCAIKGVFSLFLGGTSPLDCNSQNYSAVKTPVQPGVQLPQIVVQMPVYKESLEEVIMLSYFNVRKAMDFYISKGGSARFFICDDGFQVVSPEDAAARSRFYEANGIPFVGRPKLGRRGVFKKASNLNYQLAISDRVSSLVAERGLTPEQALLKVWEEYDREFVAAGDLRMPDDCLILLIDADTKVPEQCMWDTIGEFLESPGVAYTQHYTTPFHTQNRNFWEQHISAFTNTIYFQGIAMSVAFGDCAPLVGHNAFLRWSAMKKIGYTDESCRAGETKYWSECSVSEDFDLYIRLASANMFGRYVMYTGPEFQEGVSLTYMDEVFRFKKFAYGACEMIFNPLRLWLTRGPFTRLFRTYMACKHICWYQKVSMLTYLSSYLAMGASFWYCCFEGVMSVIDPAIHDYLIPRAFDVMLTSTVIFSGIGIVCSGILFQWRRTAGNSDTSMFKIIWDQVKFLPTTVLFFNSVLFSMTEICGIYFLGLPVAWGATTKETANPTCFQALRDTLVAYRWQYCLYVLMLGGYSFCIWNFQISLYRAWAVMSFACGHILGPILLNPAIMSLDY